MILDIMKRIVLLIIVVLSAYHVNAQGKRTIRDSFESNRFQWEEFYEKSYSCSIQDGFLQLKSDEEDQSVWSVAELPIDVDKNFEITLNFNVNSIADDCWFGIVFNYEDANNYNCFIVQEKKFRLVNMVNGVSSISRRNEIILKKGGFKDVKMEMKKKGRKLYFLVDDMDVIAITKNVTNNIFGCIVFGNTTIRLKEVIIEQMEE